MKQIIVFLVLLAVIVLAISDFIDTLKDNSKSNLNKAESLDDEQAISPADLKKSKVVKETTTVDEKKHGNNVKSKSKTNSSRKKK